MAISGYFEVCIVCYVTATKGWIFTPNVEKCDFK